MVIMFIIAATSAWASSSLVHASAVAMAHTLSTVAMGGVYVLGGIPEAVSLCYNVASSRIDTHVLMTLAVMGTLVTGAALEVWWCCVPSLLLIRCYNECVITKCVITSCVVTNVLSQSVLSQHVLS